MDDQPSRRHSEGLGPAILIVAFLIGAILCTAGVFLYRQSRLATQEAAAQRAAAQRREGEIRQLAEFQMKQLADLEEKETGADSNTPGPAAEADPAKAQAAHLAKLSTDLGEAYLSQGNRDKAIELFRDAAETLKKACGPEDPRTRAAEDRLKKAQTPGG